MPGGPFTLRRRSVAVEICGNVDKRCKNCSMRTRARAFGPAFISVNILRKTLRRWPMARSIGHTMSTIPKHEPELRRAKGRAFAASCNEIATNYDSKTIYQALELSELAHEVHGLPYTAGLSHLKKFPPDRFEWFCEAIGNTVSIKLRDKRTDTIAHWPHWAG